MNQNNLQSLIDEINNLSRYLRPIQNQLKEYKQRGLIDEKLQKEYHEKITYLRELKKQKEDLEKRKQQQSKQIINYPKIEQQNNFSTPKFKFSIPESRFKSDYSDYNSYSPDNNNLNANFTPLHIGIKNQPLEQEIENLKQQLFYKDVAISDLNDEIRKLKQENNKLNQDSLNALKAKDEIIKSLQNENEQLKIQLLNQKIEDDPPGKVWISPKSKKNIERKDPVKNRKVFDEDIKLFSKKYDPKPETINNAFKSNAKEKEFKYEILSPQEIEELNLNSKPALNNAFKSNIPTKPALNNAFKSNVKENLFNYEFLPPQEVEKINNKFNNSTQKKKKEEENEIPYGTVPEKLLPISIFNYKTEDEEKEFGFTGDPLQSEMKIFNTHPNRAAKYANRFEQLKSYAYSMSKFYQTKPFYLFEKQINQNQKLQIRMFYRGKYNVKYGTIIPDDCVGININDNIYVYPREILENRFPNIDINTLFPEEGLVSKIVNYVKNSF